MKKLACLSAMATLGMLSLASCSKDNKSTTPAVTKVEYRLTGLNFQLQNMDYVDSSGAVITDDTSAPGGTLSKTIYVTRKPFTATMHVKIDSHINTTIQTQMLILVNDSAVANTTLSTQPVSQNTGTVTYTVQ